MVPVIPPLLKAIFLIILLALSTKITQNSSCDKSSKIGCIISKTDLLEFIFGATKASSNRCLLPSSNAVIIEMAFAGPIPLN